MKSRAGNRRLNSLVIWTVIICFLVAANVAIWTFSLYVFGYPERAFNYNFLVKLDKLSPPKNYTIYSAPRGRFLSSEALYTKYYPYSPTQLSTANALLKRAYVRNYKDAIARIDYLRGKFEVYYVRDLTKDDIFPKGQVVRAFDPDFPQMIVEAILPTNGDASEKYQIGDTFVADGNGRALFATPFHVQRLEDYQLCFTLMPLVYGNIEIDAERQKAIAAPAKLNMAGTMPVTRKTLVSVPVPQPAEAPDEEEPETAETS
ncbi:MAG: hypothetical protein AAF591_17130 [Verrucomicrobiota bacterium]